MFCHFKSNLPEPTLLHLLKYSLPLSGSRQLEDYESDSFKKSNKDRDLRNPITPSVTSLGRAKMIFF